MRRLYFHEAHEGIREMAKDFAEKTLAHSRGDRQKRGIPMDVVKTMRTWAFWD
jgi:hypothetical protein